jgi:hypothetical protein
VKSKAIYLAISSLLAATLACNISTPQGAPEPTAEVVTIVATATADSQSADAPADQTTPTASPADDGSGSEGESSQAGDVLTSITENGDVITSVSIKNGEASFEGRVAFPGSETETSDNITVKPTGFDSATTSGHLNFSLTCSGRGKAKVNYKGGKVDSGSPGCGETWTVYVINGSPDSHIKIRLDASGDVNWSLSITSDE